MFLRFIAHSDKNLRPTFSNLLNHTAGPKRLQILIYMQYAHISILLVFFLILISDLKLFFTKETVHIFIYCYSILQKRTPQMSLEREGGERKERNPRITSSDVQHLSGYYMSIQKNSFIKIFYLQSFF